FGYFYIQILFCWVSELFKNIEVLPFVFDDCSFIFVKLVDWMQFNILTYRSFDHPFIYNFPSYLVDVELQVSFVFYREIEKEIIPYYKNIIYLCYQAILLCFNIFYSFLFIHCFQCKIKTLLFRQRIVLINLDSIIG